MNDTSLALLDLFCKIWTQVKPLAFTNKKYDLIDRIFLFPA